MAERKIDDHSSWVGKGSKGSVFADGAKVKEYRSAEGAGKISSYPDSSEEVLRDQSGGVSKLKSRPMKEGYRN